MAGQSQLQFSNSLQSQAMMQVPERQASSGPQSPHNPLQPSGPHSLPVQLGTQLGLQVPWAEQTNPSGHIPQLPPQPLLPHCLAVQLGTQVVEHLPL